MKKERILYFDYLRVVAAVAVIMVHVAAQDLTGFTGRSPDWHILNVFNSAGRWCVAIFMMISGSLFLSRDIEPKKLYTRHIPRLLCAYIVWCTFYALAIPFGRLLLYGDPIPVQTLFDDMVRETYHIWFIPMMIGFYMCIPLLKQFVKTEKITRYYLLLSFLFGFAIPQAVQMANDFIGGPIADILGKLNQVFVSNMKMELVLGFSFYAVLGYWLDHTEFTKKQRSLIYVLGVLGFLATVSLNAVLGWQTGALCFTYYDHFSVNVAAMAVAIHTAARYSSYGNAALNNVVAVLSKSSFGIYLVHIFVMSVFSLLGLTVRSFMPLISVPLLTAGIFAGSFAASFVISKIPVLNKWIV